MEEIILILEKQLSEALEGAGWHQKKWKEYEEKILAYKTALNKLREE